MAVLRRALRRIGSLLRPGRAEREMQREFASHLQLIIDDLVSRGMTQAEAALAARRAFGGVEQEKERHRDARSFRWVEDATRDVAYAARVLRRAPTMTAVILVTLALGVGVTTAIFSVVEAVLLRPLPYPDGDRLFQIVENVPADESVRGVPRQRPALTTDDFREWRSRTSAFARIGAYVWAVPQSVATAADGDARLISARVTADVFPLLGVQPLIGRTFDTADERPDPDVVILSASMWRRYFASDPSVPGRTLQVDGRTYTIVGVMPAGFEFPGPRPSTGSRCSPAPSNPAACRWRTLSRGFAAACRSKRRLQKVRR